jgi:hypothetical protein
VDVIDGCVDGQIFQLALAVLEESESWETEGKPVVFQSIAKILMNLPVPRWQRVFATPMS